MSVKKAWINFSNNSQKKANTSWIKHITIDSCTKGICVNSKSTSTYNLIQTKKTELKTFKDTSEMSSTLHKTNSNTNNFVPLQIISEASNTIKTHHKTNKNNHYGKSVYKGNKSSNSSNVIKKFKKVFKNEPNNCIFQNTSMKIAETKPSFFCEKRTPTENLDVYWVNNQKQGMNRPTRATNKYNKKSTHDLKKSHTKVKHRNNMDWFSNLNPLAVLTHTSSTHHSTKEITRKKKKKNNNSKHNNESLNPESTSASNINNIKFIKESALQKQKSLINDNYEQTNHHKEVDRLIEKSILNNIKNNIGWKIIRLSINKNVKDIERREIPENIEEKFILNKIKKQSQLRKKKGKIHSAQFKNKSSNESMKEVTSLYKRNFDYRASSNNIFSKNLIQKLLRNNNETKFTNNSDLNINNSLLKERHQSSVADEDVQVISPKIIKYTKQIYTNNYWNIKFQKIFQVGDNINNHTFSYLTNSDLFSLSMVNSLLFTLTKREVRRIIANKLWKGYGSIHALRDMKRFFGNYLTRSPGYYSHWYKKEYAENLCLKSKYEAEINKDLIRTFLDDDSFKKGTQNHLKLFNILKAYSNHNPSIGYAQGLNYLAAKVVLIYDKENEAFLFWNAIIKNLKFESVLGAKNDISNHMTRLFNWIRDFIPELHSYLQRNRFCHEIFTTDWVITWFANCAQNEEWLIIWKFIWIFKWKFIDMFILAILQVLLGKFINLKGVEFPSFMKGIMKSKTFKDSFRKIIEKTFEFMNRFNYETGKLKRKWCDNQQ